MSHVRRFDHVGLTVADLDAVTAFFVALGLEVEGRAFVEGEFLDTVSRKFCRGSSDSRLSRYDDATGSGRLRSTSCALTADELWDQMGKRGP